MKKSNVILIVLILIFIITFFIPNPYIKEWKIGIQTLEQYSETNLTVERYTNATRIIAGMLIFGVLLFKLAIAGQKQKNLQDKQQIDYKNKLKEIGIEKVTSSGKYLTGHPNIKQPIISGCYFTNNKLIIVKNDYTIQELGTIDLSDINDIKVEDSSTVESRITATRLIALGIFAFAAKKKEKIELFYLTISWKDGKFTQETMFEFTGTNSMSLANELKSLIVDNANKATVSG